MSHGHAHPPHRHEHTAAADRPSVLMRGAAARLAAALAGVALLWAAVAWALSDLST
jgi:hypothetical protein